MDGEYEQLQCLLSQPVVDRMTAQKVVAVKLPAACSLVTQANDLAPCHRSHKKLINHVDLEDLDRDLLNCLINVKLPALFSSCTMAKKKQLAELVAAWAYTANQAWHPRSVKKGHALAGWASDEISFSALAENGWTITDGSIKSLIDWEVANADMLREAVQQYDQFATCTEQWYDDNNVHQTPMEAKRRRKSGPQDQLQLNHRRALIFYTVGWVARLAAEKLQRQQEAREAKAKADREADAKLDKKHKQVELLLF